MSEGIVRRVLLDENVDRQFKPLYSVVERTLARRKLGSTGGGRGLVTSSIMTLGAVVLVRLERTVGKLSTEAVEEIISALTRLLGAHT